MAKVLTPSGPRTALSRDGPALPYNYALQIISLWGNKWDPKSCETWNTLLKGSRFHADNIDVKFFRPSDAGAQVNEQHVNTYQVAYSAAVTLGFGPGTLREPTERRRSQLPAKHSDCWLGQVTPTFADAQKTALVKVLVENEEEVELQPWCVLGGLSGLIGMVEELQPYEHRPQTPDMEARFSIEAKTGVEQKAEAVINIVPEHNAQKQQATV